MSLKAKIEAVIYASEEPVTLAQLVGLLGEEAQAELDREAAAQASLALSDAEADAAAVEPEASYVPGMVVVEEDSTPDEEAVQDAAPSVAQDAAPSGDGRDERTTGSPIVPADGTTDPGAGADAKAEKARAAKLRGYFRETLNELVAEYAGGDRGLEIREVAGGFRFATKPEYHDAVRGFVKSLKPPLKLSLQALETLAVIAYKQPVTAPEIAEIRGVDSGGVLGSLMARKLITTAGRKHVIGRPILYKTTKEFLLKFGLKDVGELPSIEEFETMAGQLAEQEEIPMGSDVEQAAHPVNAEQELGASPEEDGPETADRTPADDVSAEDRASVDGRISSLPPDYSQDEMDDPSAQEAAIQSEEQNQDEGGAA